MNKINMHKRRGLLEVLYAMVELCIEEKGVIKTHMMYRTNQAHRLFTKNLDIVRKIGWIEEVERGKKTFYVATDSGRRAVRGYKTIFNEIPKEYRHLVLGETTRRFLVP